MTILAKLAFPAGYDDQDCVCLSVPIALVPALGGLLGLWEYRASWVSDSDYQQGYQAAALLQWRLLNMCGPIAASGGTEDDAPDSYDLVIDGGEE